MTPPEGDIAAAGWSKRVLLDFTETIGTPNLKPDDFHQDYHIVCPGELLKTTDGSIFRIEGAQGNRQSSYPLCGHFLPGQENHPEPGEEDYLCMERSTLVRRVFRLGIRTFWRICLES